MENLILYCGNKAQGDERIMNILEIVVLMLREQVSLKVTCYILVSLSSLQKNWPVQANNKRKINAKKTTSKSA